MTRLGYLDWLRGVAVLIMVEAHTFDAWTRVEDRGGVGYRLLIDVGGLGAPIFMFLAGSAITLAAGSRLRKGLSVPDVAALARRRGWQIFGLAFLFRLQSWLISGGDPMRTLLKVDILNIMGLSMVAAAVLWAMGRDLRSRVTTLGLAAAGVVLLTPPVRAAAFLTPLPDQLEWYLREAAGITSFAIFPWTAFLLAGAAVGLVLDQARDETAQRTTNLRLGVLGIGMVLASWAALAAGVGAGGQAWEDNPVSFLLRLGVVVAAVPAALAWSLRFPGTSRLKEFGLSSLFVYWIHVEMVYGVVSLPFHRRLPFEAVLAGYLGLIALLYGLVRVKQSLTYWQQQDYDERSSRLKLRISEKSPKTG